MTKKNQFEKFSPETVHVFRPILFWVDKVPHDFIHII